ncbi:MAG: aldo/keto reductase [Thermoleophilia bacterium]|nr:aldo/keto reductase [Thermoleophilia bacterium]
MKYRVFGKLNWEASVLGLGVMRLPGRQDSGWGTVDQEAAVALIRGAIDNGVNYVDLGFPWNQAWYEPVAQVIREALKDGYRDRVRLALTAPAAKLQNKDDLLRFLTDQLRVLELDSVDFCLLGRLTRENWPRLQELGILEQMETAQSSGLFAYSGFSFHDHYQILRGILEAYDRWTLASFQFSFMDVGHDPGLTGLRLAASKGLAVVVTDPLKRGQLAANPPDLIGQIWRQSGRDWSPVEWALRFVWNQPEVAVAVVDASSREQLQEDMRIADEADSKSLTIADEVTLGAVRDAYRNRQLVPCPSCRPCMPCPVGIDVPRFFEIYNDAVIYGDKETAKFLLAQEDIHPELCNACGLCEQRCAKRLSITEWLEKGRDFFDL